MGTIVFGTRKKVVFCFFRSNNLWTKVIAEKTLPPMLPAISLGRPKTKKRRPKQTAALDVTIIIARSRLIIV
jgi:hypothetical protein